MIRDGDTIAAMATAPGRGAVGLVRISGPNVPSLIQAIVGHDLVPRRAEVVEFKAASGIPIDQGLALYFPAPRSYTGEHVLELHGHGGVVVQRLVLQRCLALGARAAEPGEFTQRAFFNNKLDLAQAEGVADLIDAATAVAARSAMRSLTGQFSQAIRALVQRVVDLRVLVEGTIDFPEEEIEFLEQGQAAAQLNTIRSALAEVLRASRQGSLLREGARIVLVGRPNVGKSSLLNRLAGDELAIVTDVPGTTRDLVRQAIDLEGVPAFVIDTAGLRESSDPVEQIGIARTWAAAGDADLVLLVVDTRQGVTPEDEAILSRLPPALPRLIVHNKIDLVGKRPRVNRIGTMTDIWVSAKDGLGVDALREALSAAIGWGGTEEGVFLARERHLSALLTAAEHLAEAGRAGSRLEIYAEELRLAQDALNTITGEFTADDLLGEIFGRFCIGK
ncbi:MAG TPA: tRNA uridine-5-carboxymethylaminomethyl(34) synthesis GTPase MnmE [Burkholderiales bacterium]